MRCLRIIVVLIVLVMIGGIYVVYSGIYNVAATDGHTGFERWLLDTTMENSVRRYTEGIKVPSLADEAIKQRGFKHYDDMCVGCHGAPGISRNDMARALTPTPPELAELKDEWTVEQLFWIIKHGIKMTGMPAWGHVHSDEELWAIAAFVDLLSGLSAERYQEMREHAAAAQNDSHEHHYDHASKQPGAGVEDAEHSHAPEQDDKHHHAPIDGQPQGPTHDTHSVEADESGP